MKIFNKYQSLFLFVGGFLLAFSLFGIPLVKDFFEGLGRFGYFGAFLGGMMFVYSLTIGFGVATLLTLAETMPHLTLSLVAGFGAMVGDLLVFNLVKKKFKGELRQIYKIFDKKEGLKKFLNRKYFKWILPVLGFVVIASPLPDELGIALVGNSKMEEKYFKIVVFLLNSLGIYVLISIV